MNNKNQAPSRRGGHITPRTPVQLPTSVARIGKRLAKKRQETFVGFLSRIIREEADRAKQ